MSLKRRLLPAALLAAFGCAAPVRRAAPPPGALLVVNARFFPEKKGADALLARNGRIEAVGPRAELEARARRTGARVQDARGGFVLPGFHDAHIHLLSGALALGWADLSEVKTPEDAARVMADYGRAHPELEVLRGRGWTYDITPSGIFPSRRDLDAAVGGRPVVLESYDGHAYWLNSAALERAGIGPTDPDPPGTRIVREQDGRTPSGAFLDAEDFLFARLRMNPSRAEKLAAYESALRRLASLGYTSIDSIAWDEPNELELLATLEKRGKLPLRVSVSPQLDGDLDLYEALRARYRGPKLRFGWLKAFVDGVIESRTAYMVDPYPGGDDRGTPRYDPDRLRARVREARCRGFAVELHAVGDGAVRLSLDAFEQAHRACPAAPGAPLDRIEHIEVVHPDDLARFKALGVVASMQPYHAVPGDGDSDAGVWAQNLGPERLKRSFAWRDLSDAGAELAFGTDWPVMSPDPLRGLAVAATRRNENGMPPQGWHAAQALSLEEAVRAFTRGPARALGIADRLGSLEPGMLADLVILSPEADLGRPETLWRARAAFVAVGGESVARTEDVSP